MKLKGDFIDTWMPHMPVTGGQMNKRHYAIVRMMMRSNKENSASSETAEIETDEPVFTDNFRIFTSSLTNASVFESY